MSTEIICAIAAEELARVRWHLERLTDYRLCGRLTADEQARYAELAACERDLLAVVGPRSLA